MEYLCPECNTTMPSVHRDSILNETYHCCNCKITIVTYEDLNVDFYIHDDDPLKYKAPPLFDQVPFNECCRLYRLRVFL